jgi:hypothetical protein
MMTMKIKLLTTRMHWTHLLSPERLKRGQGYAKLSRDEGPPHVKAVRMAERADTGRGGEGCGVCPIVVKPSSWGRRSDVGGAGLLFLEERRSGYTVARGQGNSWLLRMDHHGVFHGGRHRREYRHQIATLEEPGDVMRGGQRER